MGIINITPDSFYKASRFITEKDIADAAVRMTEDGADILDVGGYSSRPGAFDIPVKEEISRVSKAVKAIIKELPGAVVSVDTFRADVAKVAIKDCGASMINDISGGDGDINMFPLVEELNVLYVLTHMQGNPQNMQDNPVYDDVVADILRWFAPRIFRLQYSGV